jgi:hypothetical protein
MKKLILLLLALMLSGCVFWGRYPRHMDIEMRGSEGHGDHQGDEGRSHEDHGNEGHNDRH